MKSYQGMITLMVLMSMGTTFGFSLPPLERPIRVLLKESSLQAAAWCLTNEKGFFLYHPTIERVEKIVQPELHIIAQTGIISVNGKHISEEVFILPLARELSINRQRYDGYISIQPTKKKLYLINHVGLEEYLASVLPYEGIPTWPVEVLKALCIACRTYALSVMIEQRKQARPYDVRSTVDDQVYKGKSPHDLRHIVQATKDQILIYNDRPICAMYSAVCGGITPSQINSAMHRDKPYLNRTQTCNHCKQHKYYQWSYQFPFSEIEHTLNHRVGSIKDLAINSHDSAGVAQDISITGSTGSITLKAQDFRRKFPELRSIACTFETKDGTLHAQGKGHGHHLGLCQWGACAMAKNKTTHQDILSFYYPATTLTLLDNVPLAL